MVVLTMTNSRSTRWLLLAVAACLGLAASPVARQPATPRRVIRITAERFLFTPSAIDLEVGEEVELRLRSDDTAHGFRIVGGGVNLVVPKRGKGDVSAVFTPTEPGHYTFECTKMCGAGHNFMRGELIVHSRAGQPDERPKP
jgi:cytochrome c oxidase subunit II